MMCEYKILHISNYNQMTSAFCVCFISLIPTGKIPGTPQPSCTNLISELNNSNGYVSHCVFILTLLSGCVVLPVRLFPAAFCEINRAVIIAQANIKFFHARRHVSFRCCWEKREQAEAESLIAHHTRFTRARKKT
jgi:hypothetical protein